MRKGYSFCRSDGQDVGVKPFFQDSPREPRFPALWAPPLSTARHGVISTFSVVRSITQQDRLPRALIFQNAYNACDEAQCLSAKLPNSHISA
jgi:hypothetical protein